MARLNCVTILAPAKLNLALDVVGLLPGGFVAHLPRVHAEYAFHSRLCQPRLQARPREGHSRGAADEIRAFPIIPQFAADFFQQAAPHHKAARAKFIGIIRQSVHKCCISLCVIGIHP